MNVVALVQDRLQVAARRSGGFALGWNEGVQRFKAMGRSDIISASMFPAKSEEFAASQAAVAYMIAKKG